MRGSNCDAQFRRTLIELDSMSSLIRGKGCSAGLLQRLSLSFKFLVILTVIASSSIAKFVQLFARSLRSPLGTFFSVVPKAAHGVMDTDACWTVSLCTAHESYSFPCLRARRFAEIQLTGPQEGDAQRPARYLCRADRKRRDKVERETQQREKERTGNKGKM